MYELIYYIYPSPYGIDWSSPFHLATSVLRNQINREGRAIGHIHIELRHTQSQHISRTLTGMVQLSKTEERKLLLLKHMGLGILFHSFKGRLEKKEDILRDLEKRFQSGNLSFIRFQINETTYNRLKKYLEEYEANGGGNHYGLANRPRCGEGAGCTAYATSFLEIAGLLTDEMKAEWSRTIFIPKRFLEKTLFISLLVPRASTLKWAAEKDPNRKIFFWDPDNMHRWVMKKWNSAKTGYQNESLKNAKGVFLDATGTATPTDSFWMKPDALEK